MTDDYCRSIFREFYRQYCDTIQGFNDFHNTVINMPRANFREIPSMLTLLKKISSYIILLGDDFLNNEFTYRDIFCGLRQNYRDNILPEDLNRDMNFENTFLAPEGDSDFLYSDEGGLGRRFRHYMEYLSFFNVIKGGTHHKSIDIDMLHEIINTPDDILIDTLRNELLWINIGKSDFIKNQRFPHVNILEYANYCPCIAILKYCKAMNHPVTCFEVAMLLGRIDLVQDQDAVLYRAITLGSLLPENEDEQMQLIFNSLGWNNANHEIFRYANSQAPTFKFKSFILLMDAFGLVKYDNLNGFITLTEYSRDLLESNIPIQIFDLNRLLDMINDDDANQNELLSLIVNRRSEQIAEEIRDPNSQLIEALNNRILRNPSVRNGNRVRNNLIKEVAKIKANFVDEYNSALGIIDPGAQNIIQVHHIIEFNRENGPDITENLICLSPDHHAIIHHGSDRDKRDFFQQCRNSGAITFERFENMCTVYHCLAREQAFSLLYKGLITHDELNILVDLIEQNGDENVYRPNEDRF